MSKEQCYLGLARLLSYPQALEGLSETCNSIAIHFQQSGLDYPAGPFGAFLENSTLGELQEDYVAKIDFNPKGSLYLGHHLHGDNQKKAAFMIRIKQEFGRHGFDPEGNELPDHLAVILGFLAHLAARGEDDYRRQFIAETVLPGLDKMIATDPEAGSRTWQSLIDSAHKVCSADCEPPIPTPPLPLKGRERRPPLC